MNKELLLQELQGKWVSENDNQYTFEIINQLIFNHDGQKTDLMWRSDLGKWVVPGLSIIILDIKEQKLHTETPKNQLNSGVVLYVKV